MEIIREKKKIIFAIAIISLVVTITHLLLFQNVHIFHGDRYEAATLLGTMIQCLATVTAIIFTLILFIGEFSLGKYVTRTVDYVILNRFNFLMLVFFIAVIIWNICCDPIGNHLGTTTFCVIHVSNYQTSK